MQSVNKIRNISQHCTTGHKRINDIY